MDKQTASHKLAVFVCISIQTEERGGTVRWCTSMTSEPANSCILGILDLSGNETITRSTRPVMILPGKI